MPATLLGRTGTKDTKVLQTMATLTDMSYHVKGRLAPVPVFTDLDDVYDYIVAPPAVPQWRHFAMAILRKGTGPKDPANIYWHRPIWINSDEYDALAAIDEKFCDLSLWKCEADLPHFDRRGRLTRIWNENLHSVVVDVATIITPTSFEAPEFDFNFSPLTDQMNMLVLQGYRAANPGRYDSRSEAMFAAVCAMLRGRIPDEVILAALMDEDLGISVHVRAQRYPAPYARRQIKQARKLINGKR